MGFSPLLRLTYMAHEMMVRMWRNKKQYLGLVGEVCHHCDHKIFPPRDVCPNCGDEAKVLYSAPPTKEKTEETPPPDQNIFAVSLALQKV